MDHLSKIIIKDGFAQDRDRVRSVIDRIAGEALRAGDRSFIDYDGDEMIIVLWVANPFTVVADLGEFEFSDIGIKPPVKPATKYAMVDRASGETRFTTDADAATEDAFENTDLDVFFVSRKDNRVTVEAVVWFTPEGHFSLTLSDASDEEAVAIAHLAARKAAEV